MRIRTEELRPRSWISSVRCSWVKVFCIQKNNTSMPAPWTPVTAWELGISGKIDVTTCLMKRLQLSLSRWSHAWKRTRCFWHVGMIDEWLGGVWGFPNALRSQEKKSDQERYIQSSSRFNVSTLMSHRRSLTKNCCEGSFSLVVIDGCQSRRILAPIEPTKLLMASRVLCLDGPVWPSPSPASWAPEAIAAQIAKEYWAQSILVVILYRFSCHRFRQTGYFGTSTPIWNTEALGSPTSEPWDGRKVLRSSANTFRELGIETVT